MKFTDFKMKDLVGKDVVWSNSDTVKRSTEKTFTKIAQALSTGFRIEGHPDRLFSYYTGLEIIPEGRKRMLHGFVSRCDMVTEEQVVKLKEKLTEMRDKKASFHYIVGHMQDLLKLPAKDLKTIVTKMEKVNADKFKREQPKP